MLSTPNLSLPYIDVNAAQREVVHNEAIRGLDALVQLAVLDRNLAAPPGSPADGQRWIVAASPTGAWSGHATEVAAWQDGAWRFYAPQVGWQAYVVDEGVLLAWNGSAWVDALSMLTTIQNVSLFGVGTTADATNPFSAKLNNALWVAKSVAEGGDGHLRYKMSKESAGNTLSLLMQTNFSGRAEIGLAGDDDLHVKVSPDGSTWHESLVIARSSGVVGLGADGSAAAPALAFAGDPDNGIYRTGANAWSLACAGAQAVGISAASVAVAYTTASAAPTTGALTVAGGAGVAGAINAGGTIHSTATTAFTANAASTSFCLLDFMKAGASGFTIGFENGTGLGTTGLIRTNTNDPIAFMTNGNNQRMRIAADGSVTVGSPTGGDKGAGTINAVAVYDDDFLLTDYVFDKFLKLGHGPYSPRVRRLYDQLDPAMFELDAYAAYWRANRRLYGMPDLDDCVDGIVKEVSLGGMVQRLTQTAELHAIHIATVHERMLDHERRLAVLESGR